MNIGPYTLPNALALAPMAGVTDLPFRHLCKSLGAGYVVSEMLHSDPRLRHSRKSSLRRHHAGEVAPIAIQIAGSDPEWLAEAAAYNVSTGAQIIDINMGCPAKKVCNKAAGSALLENEPLVRDILDAVVKAVSVPVTLKIRTGPSPECRNGVRIAEIAEDCGITALAVHGRTRADKFRGTAEYDTIRAICSSITIPVLANGDITTPEDARRVLEVTGAAGLMIGRGAQGNPWIFREINHFLETGRQLAPPSSGEVHRVMRRHLNALHEFYGEVQGVRIARKHLNWYLGSRTGGQLMRPRLMRAQCADEQLSILDEYFFGAGTMAA